MELANNVSIVSLKDFPSYRQTLTDYVENNWKQVFKPFTDVLCQIFSGGKELPECYMMLKDDNIIGFYQLVEQELIIRKDLSPWITCVFIDEQERGQCLSSTLLEHGRTVANPIMQVKAAYIAGNTINKRLAIFAYSGVSRHSARILPPSPRRV